MYSTVNPDSADAYCEMGISYGKLGQYAEAIAAFKRAKRSSIVPMHLLGSGRSCRRSCQTCQI
jgi:pentatricopeptide repeat protein